MEMNSGQAWVNKKEIWPRFFYAPRNKSAVAARTATFFARRGWRHTALKISAAWRGAVQVSSLLYLAIVHLDIHDERYFMYKKRGRLSKKIAKKNKIYRNQTCSRSGADRSHHGSVSNFWAAGLIQNRGANLSEAVCFFHVQSNLRRHVAGVV